MENERLLNYYQQKYPNLMEFSYDPESDCLLYRGNSISLNGFWLNGINELYFNMDSDDIYTYIKNGYYLASSKLEQMNSLASDINKAMFLPPRDRDFINEFVHDFYIKSNLWKKYDEILKSDPSFMREIQNETMFISSACHSDGANSVLTAVADAWNNENDRDVNNQDTNTQTNEVSNTLSGPTRTRTSANFGKYYNEFREREENLNNNQQRNGSSGFTSILLVISSAVVFGMYLATIILK